MKILVVQRGARHRYSIPRFFAENDLLAGFYTDTCSASPIGRMAKYFRPILLGSLRRMAERNVHGISPCFIHTTDRNALNTLKRSILGTELPSTTKILVDESKVIAAFAIRKGLGNASVVYTMHSEMVDFVRWATQHGAKSIVEVYSSPYRDEIVNQHCERLGLEQQRIQVTDLDCEQKLLSEVLSLASIVLCPSPIVAREVGERFPAISAKVLVVPYGCTLQFNGATNEPMNGRIFVAGGNPVAKGLYDLAAAIELIPDSVGPLEVLVAGSLPSWAVNDSRLRSLNFLGPLSTQEMKTQFLTAYMFVMPSVTEGFPSVLAEAITAGCPVIVTEACGAPIDNGKEGIVLKTSNPTSLSEAILDLIVHPDTRSRMATECLSKREFFTPAAWSKRLVNEVKQALLEIDQNRVYL